MIPEQVHYVYDTWKQQAQNPPARGSSPTVREGALGTRAPSLTVGLLPRSHEGPAHRCVRGSTGKYIILPKYELLHEPQETASNGQGGSNTARDEQGHSGIMDRP